MKYYELLEVPPNATPAQIKAAYRILVQLHHPDRLLQANPNVRQYAEEKLKRINEAYTVLSDPARRAAYDARYTRRRTAAPEDETEDDAPRPKRPRRAPRSPEDLERDADEILRRAAEQAEAERRAAEIRARAVAAEQARREAEERLRRQAQNQFPRAQNTEQGLTVHFAPSVWTPFIRIPAGEFVMGSDPQRDPLAHAQEQPCHAVYLDAYAIGKYPVTNAQYQVFARATQRAFTFTAGTDTYPVTQVAWDDAVAFCAWLTHFIGRVFRLPTEAEWEKAARGPDGRLYPWGAAWDASRLNCGLPHVTPSPVGHFSPVGDSPYGVADLSGNVWEWCADWFDPRAYTRRVATATQSVARNPQGPQAGEGCVVRGGAFDSTPKQARCAHRNWYYPYNTRPNVGFRLVAELD